MSVYRTIGPLVNFTLKAEMHSSREISIIPKWIDLVLSSSSTMFIQKLIISSIFVCATDDFKKSRKMQYFLNA